MSSDPSGLDESPDAPDAPVPPRRRLRNSILRFTAKWGLIGAGLMLVLGLAAVAAVWGLGKTALLRYALAEAVQRSEGRLKVEGVEGSLFGSMRIARLEALPKGPALPGPRIEAQDVALDWSLLSLFKTEPYREPVIYSLLAKSVRVSLPYSAEPLKLPESLALPFGFQVNLVQVGTLRIEVAQADASQPAKLFEFRDMALRAVYSPKTAQGGTGKFEVSRIAFSQAMLSMERTRFSLEDQAPFKVQASGHARTHWLDQLLAKANFQTEPSVRGDGQAKFDFKVDGALLELNIQSKIETYKTELEGATRFRFGQERPLDDIWLRSAHFNVQNLDARAPKTDLNVDWKFAPRAGIPGELSFENRAPGSFDKQALPFTAAHLKFSLNAPQLLIGRIEASADARGLARTQLSGKGVIDFSRKQQFGTLSLPETDLELQTRELDLSQLMSALVPTQLSGPLRIKGGLLTVDLKQEPRAAGLAINGGNKGESPNPKAGAAGAGARKVLEDLGTMSLKGQIRLVENQLRYDSLQVRVKTASLLVGGALRLDASMMLDAKGRAQGFRPAEFVDMKQLDAATQANLRSLVFSGPFEVHGPLKSLGSKPDAVAAPTDNSLQLSLGFEDGSQIAARPVTGTLKARVSGQRLSEVDAFLQSQGNQLKAAGSLGLTGDRLTVSLEALNLAAIDPRLKGVLRLSGELRDRLNSPAVQAQLRGDGLVLDGLGTLGSVQGQVNLPSLAEGNLLVRLEASRLKAGELELDRIQLDAEGKASDHRFQIEGKGVGQTVKANGRGSYFPLGQQGQRYVAEISQADLSGRFRAVLDSVMRVVFRDDGLQVENAQLRLNEGRLVLQSLSLRSGEFASQGEAQNMSMRQMVKLFEDFTQKDSAAAAREATRQDDGLRLAARWNLAGTSYKDISGRATISLLEVDVPGAVKLNLNQENTADVRFNKGQLDGRVALFLPSVSFASRYTGAEWSAEGELRFVGRLQGTVDYPEYQGDLSGRNLQLLQRSMGWKVSNGVLKAHFDAKGFTLEQLRVESGQGNIELSGEARILTGAEARSRAKGLPPLQGRFRLVAHKLPIPIGPGQRLVLSGDTQVIADPQSLRWVGKLQADEGQIELRSAGVPDLPSDVVIVDARQKRAAAAAKAAAQSAATPAGATPPATVGGTAPAGSQAGSAASSAASSQAAARPDSPLRMGADLEIDLGKNLRVTGGGVDARLEGVLNLKGTLPEQPRAVGVVTVRDGTYLAYGQKLEVTRGVLRFQGELDNPALDLVAMRRFLPVEAGVQVSGTALSPRIKLTSAPEVSDAEKLSWLVLGTGLDDARSGTQTLALQQAAFSLLGNEEGGLSSSIAKVFGVDVITLGTARSAAPSEVIGRGLGPLGTNPTQAVSNATVQQNVLTIGKRLSSRVFLSYEQGLRGVWNLLRIQYDISNRLSLRAQTGSENAVDLLLFHWFD